MIHVTKNYTPGSGGRSLSSSHKNFFKSKDSKWGLDLVWETSHPEPVDVKLSERVPVGSGGVRVFVKPSS